MSSQGSANVSASLTVYQHLFRLHQSEDLAVKQESLNALPESFRQQIFYIIWHQAGQPSESDFGEVHVFDSLPKLQQAVAKVAVSIFQSLGQNEMNIISLKISEHNGNSHSADTTPVLLKTMHASLGDLTPELQRILDKWVDQATEGERRAEARSQIIEFLKDPDEIKLNLDELGLKSLPDIFEKKPFIFRLKILFLTSNCLTSFPEQFLQLQNLKDLRMFNNQLTSIPEQIGQLQKLEYLGLGGNQLASLPEQVCQLHKLTRLFLSDNPLTSVPAQIGQLQNLVYLDIENNQLNYVPEEVAQLQKLIRLSLTSNHLTSIPAQLSQMRSLDSLLLNENPTLQGLPNQLLDLNQDCLVDISGTGLSENVRANLEQACNEPGYQGPRIVFSMEQMEQHHDGELKKLPNLIAELFSILEEEPKEFPELNSLDKPEKRSIRSWLSRLSDTADYKRKGDFQKAFVKQIVGYLQQANDDPQFRQVFLNIIADATETCGDRVALSILHLGIASRIRLITDIHELRKFLIGTVWPVHMLEEIARKKTETLRFYDEIEVYLGYPIMLRERLGLEIAVQDMLYFRCSALEQKDLDQAAEFVMQQQNDEHAVCSYLASREDWINALKAQYPDRCAEIDEENYQELEAAGEDREKLDLLEANQKKRWEALTAWALVETPIILEQ
ncbi:MAG: hypothetical protein JSR39_07345 [Verrucomicrobia bacterium]|nr:hypothetical protein [Verrucomicrobiota bacterium]